MEQKDPNAKEGMRVRLISMADDPNPISPGSEGTIRLVDGMGVIHVKWDSGRTLGLIPGIDDYILQPTISDFFDKMNESGSGSSAIKSYIKKTPSVVNKSMPKPTKVSSTTKSSLKSSGIKTDQVKKSFKSANISDIKVESNQIEGGKADNMTVKDLAKKHKISTQSIEKEIKLGIPIEREHVGNSDSKAREIAMDHVFEFPDYYSNKRYGVLTSEKGLKKSNKKKEKIDYMSAGGGGGNTTAGVLGASGTYTSPAAWGAGVLTKKTGVAKPGPIKEEMTTDNTEFDDDSNNPWADNNGDGWNFNDVPTYEGGEIVDPLAKIPTTWDDSNLDISKEWDKYQNKKEGKTGRLTKEGLIKMVKNRLDETKKKYEIVNDEKIDKNLEEEELDETTTFGSVWGSNGPPVGPAFAAKKGEWQMVKRPIWKGGKILQTYEGDGVLNPITEVNNVKFNPSGKFVKIKKKCTKFPYCNQGDIKALNISNKVTGSGTYVEEETIRNIHEVAKQTGKSFDEIYYIVQSNLNEGKVKDFFLGSNRDIIKDIYKKIKIHPNLITGTSFGGRRGSFGEEECYNFNLEDLSVKICRYSGFRDVTYNLSVDNQKIEEGFLSGLASKIFNFINNKHIEHEEKIKKDSTDKIRAKLKYGNKWSEDAFNKLHGD